MENMRLAVLLTIYDRLEYLPEQLKQLAAQTDKNFDLWICNNSTKNIDHLKEIIPFKNIEYQNFYSIFGRIFLIRDYKLAEQYDAILTIDDDQIFPPNLVDQCFRQFQKGTVRSFWAFETYSDYWSRRRLKGSEIGDYAGMGGCLTPAQLWHMEEIYDVPEEYWIMDDLWVSHCIHKYTDYVIKPLNVSIEFVPDEGKKATYRKIRKQKSEFHKKYIIPYRKNRGNVAGG